LPVISPKNGTVTALTGDPTPCDPSSFLDEVKKGVVYRELAASGLGLGLLQQFLSKLSQFFNFRLFY